MNACGSGRDGWTCPQRISDAEEDPRRGVMTLLVAAANPEFQMRLPLRGGKSLPPEELVALADAITGTRVRQGADDAAFMIADRLRRLAS